MSIARTPLRIVQISDIHCGEVSFEEGLMRSAVERINGLSPDVVIVAGDLTAAGYQWEYEEAAGWLNQLEAPRVIIPGNHDSRNVGYLHFREYFGERFRKFRVAFEEERAERLRAAGITVVAVDSSEPDLNEGQIGREHYDWIAKQFDEPDDIKIFVLHHHLVAVPGTGRERNTINDAGDVLALLAGLDIDIVLSGHKHVPFFWGLNGIRRLRGLTPPSWNELEVDASTIKVFLHYPDGRRELSVVRSRQTRAMVREAFFLTDDFLQSNRVLAT
jgi:3',5'-cyclic AMP phosphodiesterase CpdA